MQDYHRFHFLTGATLTSISNVPGRLYTVNPIAINSPFANVLTQNKRAICMYDTPEYGPVAFVVIGATMVSTLLASHICSMCCIHSTDQYCRSTANCHSANAARAAFYCHRTFPCHGVSKCCVSCCMPCAHQSRLSCARKQFMHAVLQNACSLSVLTADLHSHCHLARCSPTICDLSVATVCATSTSSRGAQPR